MWLAAPAGSTQPGPAAPTAAAGSLPLYLEVFVNGAPTNLIAEFALDPATGAISSPRSELIEVGIDVPPGKRGQVALNDIPGLSYSYDAAAQTIAITASDDARRAAVISANRRPKPVDPDGTWGAVVNYDVIAGFGPGADLGGLAFNRLSVALDSWVFSPIGTLSHTGIVSTQGFDKASFLRLNTTFEYNAPGKALTFAAGDIASSSMPWGRSIRMGGVQLRRDFGLRTDLVTEPLLSFDGAAALPSTVDVFIDNNRVFSGRTGQGPYRFEDIPIYTGRGDATVVIRDENGNVTERQVAFFASRDLLKKGIVDWSVEAGHARENYGTDSFGYGRDAVISASLRFGLTDRITVQGHVEGKSDLLMAGLGASFVVANRAEVTVVGGASDYAGRQGYFGHGTFRTRIGKVSVEASSLRSGGGFADLAFATAVDLLGAGALSAGRSLLEFPLAQEVLSLSMPLGDNSNVGLGYVQSERSSSRDRILSLSYGHALDWNSASVSVTVSFDFVSQDPRLSAYLSIPVGTRSYTQLNATIDEDQNSSQGLNFTRAMGDAVGDHGYQVNIDFGDDTPAWQLSAALRTRYGRAESTLRSAGGTTSGHVRFDGALVLAGGHVMAGNKIHDGFAVVDVGVPDASIYLQNREVARTGASGRALVPGLTSYGENRVSLNVDELPADATYAVSAMDVVPARRSGVVVDFGGSDGGAAALVVLRGPSGGFVPVGSLVTLEGHEFVVGYDGAAYLEGLKPSNRITVATAGGTCAAQFDFAPSGGPQTVIDPVICQ